MIRKLIAALVVAAFALVCSAPQEKTIDRDRIDQNKAKASSRLKGERGAE